MNKNRPVLAIQSEPFTVRLRDKLAALKWSAAKAAVVCDVSEKTMHNWIHGRSSPPKRGEIIMEEDVFESIQSFHENATKAKFQNQANAVLGQPANRPTAPKPAVAAANPGNARSDWDPVELDRQRRAAGEAFIAKRELDAKLALAKSAEEYEAILLASPAAEPDAM